MSRSANWGPYKVRLIIQDLDENSLFDRFVTKREDFVVTIQLPSKSVVLDLYGHYIRYTEMDSTDGYFAFDFVANTYVKFGVCQQERRELRIFIFKA